MRVTHVLRSFGTFLCLSNVMKIDSNCVFIFLAKLCTNNHLHHESRGEGNSRHIVVWKSGAATGHVMGSGGESSYSSRSDIAVLPSTSEETACAPVKVHCLVSESDHSDSDSSSGQDVTMDTNKDAVTVSVTSATGISAPAGKSTKQALVPTEPLSVKLPAYTDGQAKPLIGTAGKDILLFSSFSLIKMVPF